MKTTKLKSKDNLVRVLLPRKSSPLGEFYSGIKEIKKKSKRIILQNPKDQFDMLMDCLLDI